MANLVWYFLGAYGFTWALQLLIPALGLPYGGAPAQVLYVLSIGGPMLAAILVSAREGGKGQVRELFAQVKRWRFGLGWYLVAMFTVLAVDLSGAGLHLLSGGALSGSLFQWPDGGIALMVAGQVWVAFGEELGWRGFALPRLLARTGPVQAALLMGLAHAAWHLPMFLVPGSNQYGSSFLMYWYTVTAWSFVWTLLRTRTGSVVSAMVFHAFLNFWAFTLAVPDRGYLLTKPIWLVIMGVIAWQLTRGTPAPRRMGGKADGILHQEIP